ncbi:hypothetical protein EVAR_96591_1 [Eumeta japonica]|uniref:Uncharacterized protein n=1 Tax=Eumeta variegata TaxID=151549 RepID=A0A4C1WSG8_EUMVA|nr:hypothetical protein EVAR_96591_1 [Eumeta japonica]
MRRSVRDSTRRRRTLARAHSDTDCRYRDQRDTRDSGYGSGRARPRPPGPARPRSQPPPRTNRPPHASQPLPLDDFPKVSLPLRDLEAALQQLEEHRNEASTKTSRGDQFEMRDLYLADDDEGRVLHAERRRDRDYDFDSPRPRRDRRVRAANDCSRRANIHF